MFWWVTFWQKGETFMLSLIVLPGELLRCRRNTTYQSVAHLPLSFYSLIFNLAGSFRGFLFSFSHSQINLTTKINTSVV